MMRRFKVSIMLLGMLLCFAIPGMAQAHVLKSDNGVTSVLHVAPYDAPIANEKTRLEFQFSSGFTLNDYRTTVQINDGSANVSTATIEPAYFGTSMLGVATVVFPKAAVYDIRLVGAPQASSPGFRIDYMVRVTANEKTSTMSTKSGQTIAISLTVFALFVIVAARQIVRGKRYSKKVEEKK
jgi:hypothetical protein